MKVSSNYVHQLAMKLASDGDKLIHQAFEEADYSKNETQNLHDSYGSAVFYNGKIYPQTTRFLDRLATDKGVKVNGRYITGRQSIEEFFSKYNPPSKGMQLVVAVALFYGGILEGGESPLKRKYKVIFMIGDDISLLSSKIKGSKVKTIGNG